MSNMKIGKYGENLAADFLEKNGYVVIDRNYKFSRYGEIDIIAKEKEDLCFIEVKTRTSNKFGTPYDAITKDKISKMVKCIQNYTTNTKIKYKRARIDILCIEIKNKPEITLIKNIEL